MAAPFAAIYQYAHHHIFNRIITTGPPLAAGNLAPDSSITRLHKIYAFTLLALLALLQIQSAGNTTSSPFQVHPVTTSASVFGVLGYHLAFMASLRLPQYAPKLSKVMGAFASFSLACLVTLLLPQSWWHVRYTFYVLLVVVELHQPLIALYEVGRFVWTMRRLWWPADSARQLLPL